MDDQLLSLLCFNCFCQSSQANSVIFEFLFLFIFGWLVTLGSNALTRILEPFFFVWKQSILELYCRSCIICLQSCILHSTQQLIYIYHIVFYGITLKILKMLLIREMMYPKRLLRLLMLYRFWEQGCGSPISYVFLFSSHLSFLLLFELLNCLILADLHGPLPF